MGRCLILNSLNILVLLFSSLKAKKELSLLRKGGNKIFKNEIFIILDN